MKIKIQKVTYPNIPDKCSHEWRLFGTRMNEEVCLPMGCVYGWVICDKCGWNPFVEEYKIIGQQGGRPSGGPFNWDADALVEIVKWGDEKEPPTEPVIVEYAYLEQGVASSWWDKMKAKLDAWRNWQPH
jgi:hypothetical protein